MLEIRKVTKTYQSGGLKRTVLKKVSLNFRTSEFAAILGPSGSGKTTLLNIVGGLDDYTTGNLIINEKSTKHFRDKDWDAYRNHRIGFVFQSYNLIPHQTVLQNVRLALTLSGISKKESIRRAKQALKDVGLAEHIDKRPAQLSGGQMQRVAIARALVNDPDILLADEPTGALDSETSLQIMNLLAEIAKDKLVVMVTHNPELAETYATRIITLKDGKIISDSNPYDGKVKTNIDAVSAKHKSKKTKMSFRTALSLSLRNLLTKKGRTILVALAGSIGIIGIALISAVSTGFQNYIDKIEEDTLTSYPLTLMEEAADFTGILLGMQNNNGGSNGAANTVQENQILTSALGSVSNNDLKSFREYLNRHYGEVENDIRLIEDEYNVDPLIYTIDATGKLAKLNPSNLFTSLIGESSLLSNYSSMTSVFQQYELANLQEDTALIAGRYPERYDELTLILNNPGQISDFLTYSLGFRDTEELNNILSKILSGESVNVNNQPLTLTYDDLMAADLRLIPATATYKYNDKYDVYEDMTGDAEYMRALYDNGSDRLHIVGIATPNTEMLSGGSGVAYLPSLVTHIIEQSAETEVVKKQLANPTIDVFSGTKFGEEASGFNFEFSDLVSVDNAKLAQAFQVTIDQNAISAKTTEYMSDIANDLTADITPIEDTLTNRFKSLAQDLSDRIAGPGHTGTFMKSDISTIVTDFMKEQNFDELAASYGIPADTFCTSYTGLLSGLFEAYTEAYKIVNPLYDPDTMPAPIIPEIFTATLTQYLAAAPVAKGIQSLAIALTEVNMKRSVLTKIGGLTAYLTSEFSQAFNIDQAALLSAFQLNFSEDELSRVVTAMFTKKKSTLATNLSTLGYQDLAKPTKIAFYFNSFDGKTHFMEFLDSYNDLMRSYNDEERVIDYTDTTGALMSSVKTIVDAVSYVLIAFVSISLIVSSIMIGVITYISVYERTKEIGILRAIGASKHNISSIFNAETVIIGFLAGVFGIAFSYLMIPPINFVLHFFTGDIPLNVMLDPRTALILIALSIVLTLIGGLIPARSASKKDPVEALRSE